MKMEHKLDNHDRLRIDRITTQLETFNKNFKELNNNFKNAGKNMQDFKKEARKLVSCFRDISKIDDSEPSGGTVHSTI